MEIAVLSVPSPYDFEDSNGRQIKGFKVIFRQLGAEPDARTYGPDLIIKNFSDVSLRSQFNPSKVPGVYDMDISQSFTGKGRVREVVREFKYLRPLKLDDLL